MDECDREFIELQIQRLRKSERSLRAAMNQRLFEETDMAKGDAASVLAALATQTTATVGAEASAIVLLNGLQAQIAAAVAAALAGGATAAQLAPVSDIVTQLATSQASLAAAVAANQPPSP